MDRRPHERPRSSAWVTARRERDSEIVDTRSDYVLVSAPLAQRLVHADVVVGAASDHHAVVAELS